MAVKAAIARDDVVSITKATLEQQGHVLFYGPPGTGKTTLAQHSRKDNQRIYSWTCTAEQSAASLIGHFVPAGTGKFSWHDGPAIRAWREGGLLNINEIDQASPDVADALHPILDDADVAALTLSTGETVYPHADFRCIATMNGHPRDLPDAVLDRFHVNILVKEPGKEQLDLLPEDVRKVCKNVYVALTGDETKPQFSYRQLRNFATLREQLGAETAALAVMTSRELAVALLEALLMAVAKK